MNYSYYINQIISKLNNADSDAEIKQILKEAVKQLRYLDLGVSNQNLLNTFREYLSQDNSVMIENQKRYEEILRIVMQESDEG